MALLVETERAHKVSDFISESDPYFRWKVQNEISNLQASIHKRAFDGKLPGLPSDFRIFNSTIDRTDLIGANFHPNIVNDILQTDEREAFAIRLRNYVTDIYNPAVNVGLRVDTNFPTVLFGTKLYVSSAKPHANIESLNYSKGIVGQEKSDNFGETRINDPFNPEHTTHDRRLAKSVLNLVGNLLDQNRLILSYVSHPHIK